MFDDSDPDRMSSSNPVSVSAARSAGSVPGMVCAGNGIKPVSVYIQNMFGMWGGQALSRGNRANP